MVKLYKSALGIVIDALPTEHCWHKVRVYGKVVHIYYHNPIIIIIVITVNDAVISIYCTSGCLLRQLGTSCNNNIHNTLSVVFAFVMHSTLVPLKYNPNSLILYCLKIQVESLWKSALDNVSLD